MHKDKTRNQIIEDALAGGLFGAALGALLTNKRNNTLAAVLLGAAIGASVKVLQEAKEYNLSVMIEEDGILYTMHPNGSKEQVMKLKKSGKVIPKSFTIG
ncbi:MAG: glycine zipper 2TM domain-containing protein [Bacteroidetes bacterium]|nr:glycine zipper 2TM domain-containing protein [Bacteroidota bacterium]